MSLIYMDKNWNDEVFDINFSGRIGRETFIKSFFLRTILIFLGFFFLVYLAKHLELNENFIGFLVIILWGYSILLQLGSNMRRCHDFGWSGWSLLLSVIPFVNIVFVTMLFIRKGAAGKNEYGE